VSKNLPRRYYFGMRVRPRPRRPVIRLTLLNSGYFMIATDTISLSWNKPLQPHLLLPIMGHPTTVHRSFMRAGKAGGSLLVGPPNLPNPNRPSLAQSVSAYSRYLHARLLPERLRRLSTRKPDTLEGISTPAETYPSLFATSWSGNCVVCRARDYFAAWVLCKLARCYR